MSQKIKLTVYIEYGKIFFDEKEVTQPKQIAKIVKGYISHLGDVKVYYQAPPEKWWQKLICSMVGDIYY